MDVEKSGLLNSFYYIEVLTGIRYIVVRYIEVLQYEVID